MLQAIQSADCSYSGQARSARAPEQPSKQSHRLAGVEVDFPSDGRNAAYRRLAAAVLGLDTQSLARQLRAQREAGAGFGEAVGGRSAARANLQVRPIPIVGRWR